MYILVGLGWFGGWVLGIIGFFSARRANAELRMLRAALGERPISPAAPATLADMADVTPVAEVVPPAHVEAPKPPAPRRDIEALITTNWGVWLGSAALLFAGIFLV